MDRKLANYKLWWKKNNTDEEECSHDISNMCDVGLNACFSAIGNKLLKIKALTFHLCINETRLTVVVIIYTYIYMFNMKSLTIQTWFYDIKV